MGLKKRKKNTHDIDQINNFIAAVTLPATLLKIADVIDNPWQIAADRSIKAGVGKVDSFYM